MRSEEVSCFETIDTFFFFFTIIILPVIMGFWSSTSSFGNICGGALVGFLYFVMEREVAWKAAMIIAGSIVGLQALVVFFFLISDPSHLFNKSTINCNLQETNALDINEKNNQSDANPVIDVNQLNEEQTTSQEIHHAEGISFCRAWLIPGVS